MADELPDRPSPPAASSVDQRAQKGRAARRAAPRSSLARWEPPPTRADPVALVTKQEEGRVPDLLPIRHERMLSSPFAFYRGAASIMAADLASVPDTGLRVQCCGDAHLANFGGFLAPDRQLVFDMNDFDETSSGPFEWDVKRLAASFELAGRGRGFPAATRRAAVLQCVLAYRVAMQRFATLTNLDVWYSRLDAEAVISRAQARLPAAQVRRLERDLFRAPDRNNLRALTKLTTRVDGELRFRSNPPLLVRLAELNSESNVAALHNRLADGLHGYRASLPADRCHLLARYRLVDFARKVVGVGSVGTRCWVALFVGRDDDDPLLLQVKEADQSALEPYAGRSRYANHGRRVVEGQRLLQAASDTLLGWLRIRALDGTESDYYVRQLWDGKISLDLDGIGPEGLKTYGELCGWALARGHARSGDPVAIAAYLGSGDTFDRALAAFAAAYADQSEADFASMTAAAKEGRLALPTGESGQRPPRPGRGSRSAG